MTFRDLKKRFIPKQEEDLDFLLEQPNFTLLTERIRDKPFWIWQSEEKHRQVYKMTDKNCCFNHIIGCPQKDGVVKPLFDYQKILYDTLFLEDGSFQDHHLFCKKATGIGATEFFLRLMAWLCLKDDNMQGHQMVIVTGPNVDIATKLIRRMKALFLKRHNITFNSKETVLELNGCHIESYPSHHVDSFRALESPKFILVDEGDFFPIGQQQDIRHVSERYIAKSDPYIVLCSTPNAPDMLFENIEKEPDNVCIYRKVFLDYRYGLNKIFTEEEIRKAEQSPSFEREYNLKYLGMIGNVFSTKDIDAAIQKGETYNPDGEVNYYTKKILACDPGFGSSAFGIVVAQHADKQIQILEAEDYSRVGYEEMLEIIWNLLIKYGRTINKIYVDGANPSFIKSLKLRIGEDDDYDQVIKESKASGRDPEIDLGVVVPVNFAEGRAMLANCKMLMEKDGGYISINKKFSKLITSLRTAVEKGEGVLDKEATSYDDIFDSFRMAMRFFFFRDKYETERKYADVQSFEFQRRFSK